MIKPLVNWKIDPKYLKIERKLFSNYHVNIFIFTQCWLWDGPYDSKGYGKLNIDDIKDSIHRISARMYLGYDDLYIIQNIKVLHECDVRNCFNPNHLFFGTIAENNKDRDNKGRTRTSIGENNGGHKITEELVLEIRNFAKQNRMAQLDIGHKFGLSQAQIGRILNKRSWSHI